MNAIITYLKNTRNETKHIVWPSGRQVAAFTVAVIAISLLVAGMLGLFDQIFTEAIQLI